MPRGTAVRGRADQRVRVAQIVRPVGVKTQICEGGSEGAGGSRVGVGRRVAKKLTEESDKCKTDKTPQQASLELWSRAISAGNFLKTLHIIGL